jgi:release factor glutamine methyltransferase
MPGSPLFRAWFHFLAYHLYARPKISRTDHVRLFGFSITVPPSVFHPSLYFSSRFLGSSIAELELAGKRVLDMGCGSGILSLIAASKGAMVAAIDLNPIAVSATRENARNNNLDQQIAVYAGNLFDPLPDSQKFDYIFFNPPFYRGEALNDAQHAWKAGNNYEVIRSFARYARGRLTSNGVILLVSSTETQDDHLASMFGEQGYNVTLVRSKKVLFEELMIYSIAQNP